MYIHDLRPGGACLVKDIYGQRHLALTTTGRNNLPGLTPSAGAPRGQTPSSTQYHCSSSERMITHSSWRLEIRDVSSGQIRSLQ